MNDWRPIFKRAFSLRNHMGLMLLATALFGVLANRWLLSVGVRELWLRHPVAIILSYLFFLVTVWVWLSFIVKVFPLPKQRELKRSRGNKSNSSATPKDSSWCQDGSNTLEDGLDLVTYLPDDECGYLLIIIVGLFASIGGGSVYLIYSAPEILSEAIFEFLLAGSFIRSFRGLKEPNWFLSLISRTFKPFGIVLLSSLIFGASVSILCPKSFTISEVLHTCG